MTRSGDRSAAVPLDTSREMSDAQVRRWREMSAAEKAALVSALSLATHRLAEAGIAARYPDAGPRERFLRLAILRLGRTLAVEVYPDAAHLSA